MTAPSGHGATHAARRVVLLFVAALAAAAGAAIVVLVGGDADDDAAIAEQAVSTIGPTPGADIAAHVATRTDALAALDGRVVAVVSFDRYVPAAEVGDLLGGGVEAEALFVAMPGGEPTLTTDPAAFRSAAVAEAQSQLTEIRALVPTVDDEEFAEFYRAEIVRYEQVVAAAERADIVFAALVRSTGPEMRAVASRPGIRLVDAVGGTVAAPDATLGGLRPEETGRAGTPEFRPGSG